MSRDQGLDRLDQTPKTSTIASWREQDSVRPLGLKHPLTKTWHRMVIGQNKGELKTYLEPQQIALSPAGAAKLVMAVRMQLEVRRDFICFKLDLKNAYNEISRASIIEVLEAEPSLKHLASFFAVTSYKEPSRLRRVLHTSESDASKLTIPSILKPSSWASMYIK